MVSAASDSQQRRRRIASLLIGAAITIGGLLAIWRWNPANDGGLGAGLIVAGALLLAHGLFDIAYLPESPSIRAFLASLAAAAAGFALGIWSPNAFAQNAGAALIATGVSFIAAGVAARGWDNARGQHRNTSRPNLRGQDVLTPLTPRYVSDQHRFYLEHLNDAINNPRLHNIALTGRYGAGKSSVVEAFAEQPELRRRVLLLALSTFGPETDTDNRTNQIEKELVKQLLHRERPSRLPQSRYQRIRVLNWWRAAAEATAVILAGVAAGFLLGASTDDLPGLGSDQPTVVKWVACGLTIVVLLGLLTWARLAFQSRTVVAGLSAAGATISIADSAKSYFDKYLDEIVYFFEKSSRVDIVIFEDLDRFNDPGIFEALRELNSLLNGSKQMGDRDIRFIYALRDSIFERLGYDSRGAGDDAADAEAVRANRTKFFDLVIPMVPFITHRNARDLLAQLLAGRALPEGSGPSLRLVDLVSRHLPEMRLLTNIVNEYTVFATRLISQGRGVERLDADQLFAMIVYKNIHLSDFEMIQLGRSRLDDLYRQSREMVSDCTAERRHQLSQLSGAVASKAALNRQVEPFGKKLEWFVDQLRKHHHRHHTVSSLSTAGKSFPPADITDVEFWRAVLSGDLQIQVTLTRAGQQTVQIEIGPDELRTLLGPRLNIDRWQSDSLEKIAREQKRLQEDIRHLSHIGFAGLAARKDFVLLLDDKGVSFDELIEICIDSEIGRNLIRDGYIDAHYALYVAQYYGERVPRNSMNFILQHVEQNYPDVLYAFENDEEIEAVLREASDTFLSEQSAYNVAILDFLLAHRRAGQGGQLLSSILSRLGEPELRFIEMYLAEGNEATAAVCDLAPEWSGVFVHLVRSEGLDEARRLQLLNAALAHSDPQLNYELGDEVREFLQAHYQQLPALEDQGGPGGASPFEAHDRSARAAALMARAGFVCDDLAAVGEVARRAFVQQDAYELTAANLRSATGSRVLSLDILRERNGEVYLDAIRQPRAYVSALEEAGRPNLATEVDEADGQTATEWSVRDPSLFDDIVTDLAELEHDDVVLLLERAHPGCTVRLLSATPPETWRALAKCGRFATSVANFDSYLQHVGGVDSDLAGLLVASDCEFVASDAADETAGGVEDGSREQRVAESVLAAGGALANPADRARAIASLKLAERLPLQAVPTERGPLLGELLKHGLVAEAPETFSRFAPLDWPTLSHALPYSPRLGEIITLGQLAGGTIASLLADVHVSDDTKRAVLGRFEELVLADDSLALAAAGHAALQVSTQLALTHIGAIASGTQDPSVVMRLLERFGADLSVDELLDVLAQIGRSPYTELRGLAADAKLDFQRDGAHETVLKRLNVPGRFSVRLLNKRIGRDPQVRVTAQPGPTPAA